MNAAGNRIISGAPEGQDARLLAERARALAPGGRALVHIALDDARAAALRELLAFFAPDVKTVFFPAWDCLPYDRVSPHNEIVAARVAALGTLLSWQKESARHPRMLITTVNAAIQKVVPRKALEDAVLDIACGRTLGQAALQSFLQKNGYMRADTVREAGEYAVRGGIVDLFPPGQERPLRLDLFGDDVESIRAFDPATQLTEEKLSSVSLHPATEFFLDEESVARFRARYREMFGVVRDDDPLYEAVSAQRRYNGMDHWMPLFFESLETLFDYVPGADITLDHLAAQARDERMTQIEDFYQSRKILEQQVVKTKKNAGMSGSVYHPVPPALLYVEEAAWHGLTGESPALSPFGGEGALDGGGRKGRDFGDIRALPDGDVFAAFYEYVRAQREAGRAILVAAYSAGSKERLRGLMAHAGFANFMDVEGAQALKKLGRYDTGMAVLALEHGFTAPGLCVISEQDILGDRLARRSARRKKAENFLREASSLAPGDLVVHADHGIGRFDGLETLKAAGKLHDCLKIVYAGDDRLFVPVENIEVLTRFGGDEGTVQLDRLGGAGWQARKARVKKNLMAIADHLLKIAAFRHTQKTEIFHIDKELYEDFSSGFPYQETDDQQRSIDAVLEDLSRDYPMDRLVCGDVGFGKTEVALRAACAVAMNGAQVAVVVPTTLLARQHYRNFMQRFKGLGLRVAQLSRLVTAQEAKRIREALAEGKISIVIGTHALFSESVKFAHLGLVIVDEEQRFGVKQKEKLKELKAGVHVLTLSATPIPRTLQLSLTGVRDMSLIATPPVDRLAIRTFVLPFDPMVIREAILREHYRGGQTFYVCPRVSDLAEVEEQLRELVPEVRLISAHGQMSATELEDRMSAFYDGQYDILLATNIIESGIDIPTANTMVVHRADMFGLAQLYQIRGRIGRSKQRAYAYLTYEAGRKLTAQGQKRLEVIETLDTLGAGFQLASHDMDIRGAGNLLGEEQSGHIKEVGVELYQQMLEEAVAAARAGLDWEKGESAAADRWVPQINIGTSVLIPDHYVEDLTVRMGLYRRLSDLEEKEDIEAFAAELIDRFGPLPEEVANLLDIVAIKQLSRKAGVASVEAGPKGAVFGFYKDAPPNVQGLMRWLQEKSGAVKLRPDNKIVAIRQWDGAAERVRGVQSLMKELAALG